MASDKKYKLNPETLLYEIDKVSTGTKVGRVLSAVTATAAMCFFYIWLYTSVLGLDLPKTILLRRSNAVLRSRMELLDRRIDALDRTLEGLRLRDDEIYRNIFGMNEISASVRSSGFGGVNRYSYLDPLPEGSPLRRTAVRLDLLTKKAYVQSKSYDDVSAVSRQAGDMASHIPAIPPLMTDPTKYRLSSPFGYRSDPLNGNTKMHTGFDFACNPGNNVYATGDGTVVKVSFELFGYGHHVIIDHGFGYKTRYAHMRDINVVEGMKITRGECIGTTGNTGRTSGPHLHYEVMYKDNYVNPGNYFDLSMPLEEYKEMVRRAEEESPNVLTTHKRIKR